MSAAESRAERRRAQRAEQQFDRAIEKLIREDGDHCSVCRVHFAFNSPTFYGKSRAGRLVIVGKCCLIELSSISCVGFYVEREPPWKADDRQWFEAHPTRSHRFRGLFPGEMAAAIAEQTAEVIPPPSGFSAVIVRQLEPGTRRRVPVGANGPDSSLPDDEAFLHAFLDRLLARGDPVQVCDPDVVALAEDYAAARERSRHERGRDARGSARHRRSRNARFSLPLR
jgi:hypothetical protein